MKFKVGDWVRVTETFPGLVRYGEVGQIIETDCCHMVFHIQLDRGQTMWLSGCYIEPDNEDLILFALEFLKSNLEDDVVAAFYHLDEDDDVTEDMLNSLQKEIERVRVAVINGRERKIGETNNGSDTL